MASRNEYAAEYRDETADYIISTGRPIAEACRELGINPKTGGRWVKERRGRLSGALPTREEDAETRALRKRVRELEMENELLKKAAALFAREQGQPRATGSWRRRRPASP